MPDEIKPALTPEEWAVRKRPQYYQEQPCIRLSSDGKELRLSEDVVRDGEVVDESPWLVVDDAASRHALAALALHGQPFGFTREDVKALNGLIAYLHIHHFDVADIASITARVAALLPAETTNGG